MKLLTRHISLTVLQAIAMTAVILIGIEFFILFVNELDDLGRGQYGVLEALTFVCLQLPMQLYQLAPMVSLIGSLMGLGTLAAHSELTVMRASGLSPLQLSRVVLMTALVLMALIAGLGETVAPQARQMAVNLKAIQTSQGQALRDRGGVWLRRDDHYIHIGTILDARHLKKIADFVFSKQGVLKQARSIDEAVYDNNHWQLTQVETTTFFKTKTRTQHNADHTWEISLKPQLLQLAKLDPEEMTTRQLHATIQNKKQHHLATQRYALLFWERVMQPFATMVMMLLAIPFVFGSLRTASVGARLATGLMVGLGFYFMNRLLGPLSLVTHLPASLSASLPTLMVACFGLYLHKKASQRQKIVV